MDNQDPNYKFDIFVIDSEGANRPISDAAVNVYRRYQRPPSGGQTQRGKPAQSQPPVPLAPFIPERKTDREGRCPVELPEGSYTITATAFGGCTKHIDIPRDTQTTGRVELPIPVGFSLDWKRAGDDANSKAFSEAREGGAIRASLTWNKSIGTQVPTTLTTSLGSVISEYLQDDAGGHVTRYYFVDLRGARGIAKLVATLGGNSPLLEDALDVPVPSDTQSITGDVSVTMRRAATEATEDLPLWVVIRKSTEALSFNNYFRFMNHVLCGERLPGGTLDFEASKFPDKRRAFVDLQNRRFLPFTDAEAYRILKAATEAFVIVNCGVALKSFPFDTDDIDYVTKRVGRTVALNDLWHKYLVAVNGVADTTLPYFALIRAKLSDVPIKRTMFAFEDSDLPVGCSGILHEKLAEPCLLELIWSYWHEEGMLVQTINSVTRRFQNVRGPKDNDPLGNLEIDPLRPLNNLFWGYIQDEQHRLTVVRRNYEYDHHYGLRLEGRAVVDVRAADTRSKFLEAFHNLLHLCAPFFKQDDDTTVVADGFPVLNGLKDVHLILSQGAHNQFGDLPSTARIEMLMQEWLLARPEFREFLPTRIMVAYPEPWMDRVDAMKKIQGWTDTSVLNFRNLGVFGEQILLSIRYGNWSDVNDPMQAANWARFWRPEIQGYVHAYRSVTGVDLTAENVGGAVDFTLPSALLQKRLATQQRSA